MDSDIAGLAIGIGTAAAAAHERGKAASEAMLPMLQKLVEARVRWLDAHAKAPLCGNVGNVGECGQPICMVREEHTRKLWERIQPDAGTPKAKSDAMPFKFCHVCESWDGSECIMGIGCNGCMPHDGCAHFRATTPEPQDEDGCWNCHHHGGLHKCGAGMMLQLDGRGCKKHKQRNVKGQEVECCAACLNERTEACTNPASMNTLHVKHPCTGFTRRMGCWNCGVWNEAAYSCGKAIDHAGGGYGCDGHMPMPLPEAEKAAEPAV